MEDSKDKKQERKPRKKKVTVKDVQSVSQSKEVVTFVSESEAKGLKKKEYSLSRNVAEVLALKGLGKIK